MPTTVDDSRWSSAAQYREPAEEPLITPILHHFPLCPFSRKLRLVLYEKGIASDLVEVEPWRREEAFLALNPAAEVPVLVAGDTVVADSMAIQEYLEEVAPEPSLLGQDQAERNEVRRLLGWFDSKFCREVTEPLWRQKLIWRLKGSGTPNSETMRAGSANLRLHLDYIAHLTLSRNWLVGDKITLADLAAAAHLSVLDYLGDVPWAANNDAKEWYARIKSRPSFRSLLRDRITSVRPPDHYDDLDF
ncbi:MAG: glutathione S-transferase family protein [Geminicoccaceae bacterium]